MNSNMKWIVANVVLLIAFGIVAQATGNTVWWTAFGISVAVLGFLWWVVKPAMARRDDS